jgi:para-nitrobenzyl esterase
VTHTDATSHGSHTADGDGAADRPAWSCAAGRVVGWREDGVLRATGIRYARAARFAAPHAEPVSTGDLDATAWSPQCPQAPSPLLEAVMGRSTRTLPVNEHCQHLSITMPDDLAGGELVPVMVWIHGGSYTTGAGDLPHYDPTALVREQRVIVVAVTYRLGMLGYAPGLSANLGLLDQLEALRWVRRNITAFGGDPENVTAFGESAGGDAIVDLLLAQEDERLFRRAIIQSAPFGIVRGRARMSAAMTTALLTALPEPDHSGPAEDVVTAQAQVQAAAKRFGLKGGMPFSAQYGQSPLPPEADIEAALAAVAADVDILVGNNHSEAALFLAGTPLTARLEALPLLGSRLRNGLVRLLTRRIYGAGATTFAQQHADGGGTAYRYTLRWGIPGNPFDGAHASELPLLLGGRAAWEHGELMAGADWDDVDAAGRTLRGLWAGFARTGRLPELHEDRVIDIHQVTSAKATGVRAG